MKSHKNYSSIIREIIEKRACAVFLNTDDRLAIKSNKEIDYPDVSGNPSLGSFEIYTVDLDDTLFYNEYAMEVFPDYVIDICNLTGLHPAEVKNLIYSEHYWRLSQGMYTAFDWESIVYSVARRLNITKRWNLKELQEKYYSADNVFLMNGAIEFLESINGKAVAATNGFSKYQLKILEKLNIRHYFNRILSPDITHYTKGNVKFYSDYAGLNRIHVGDDYFFDVEIPLQSGSSTLWVYGNGKFPIGGYEALPNAMAPDISSAIRLLGKR
ncbi:MAG: HAD family hydrolase [Conexivisphaerales archaeon]